MSDRKRKGRKKERSLKTDWTKSVVFSDVNTKMLI